MINVTIKGGRVVYDHGVEDVDLAISAGRIEAAGPGLEAAGDVIDASGLLVFPGMVDTHVHLMEPESTHREDFPSGTRAAAARGVTTIVEHTHAHPVRSPEDLAAKRAHLEGRSNVDYGLAAHLWPDDVRGIEEMWAAGASFFKMFTCTTHGVPGLDPASVKAAFEELARVDGRALVHAEDESLTAQAEKTLKTEVRTDPGILLEWRSREAELVAIATVGVLAAASGAVITMAHVSHSGAAEVVGFWRDRGADLVAEACPQYLALEEGEVFENGPLRKFTPPARIRTEGERAAMWEAVRSGAFYHFSTDHAPSTRDQKEEEDMWTAPFGLPGLDTTFPFLLDAALRGVITLSEVANLYSSAPARRFGLHPRKGSLRPGADADLVLVDPTGSWTVREDDIHSKAGWSPYTGRTMQGRVDAVYLRGDLVTESGRPLDRRTGRFLLGAGARV